MTLSMSQSASEAEPGLLSRPPAPNNGDNTMRKADMDLAGRDLTEGLLTARGPVGGPFCPQSYSWLGSHWFLPHQQSVTASPIPVLFWSPHHAISTHSPRSVTGAPA